MRKTICDVVLAGGGVMGLSTAFNLARYIDPAKITVVEPDPTYANSASARSWASIRQQFSLPENIKLSQSSMEFIDNINSHLGVYESDEVSINYKQGSYLFLAKQENAHLLEQNIAVQKKAGVKVRRYDTNSLKAKYPYLNCEDIGLGSDCGEGEGWFDPWLLLMAYKEKVKSLGVRIVTGKVAGFSEGNSLQIVERDGSESTLHYGSFVNATGIHARYTNQLLNQALEKGHRFALPVIPQRRQTFNIACRGGPKNLPLMLCPLKTVIRSEGDNYIVLYSDGELVDNPEELEDFGEVDHAIFEERIWENLAYRIPAFEATKVLGGWVGYYEFNTLDQNALIGQHPLVNHHFFINGFSGHGIQQAPAAGQCLAETMCGVEPHIDIRALSLQRVIDNKPYRERNIL